MRRRFALYSGHMVYVVGDVGVAAAARHDIKSQNIWYRAVECVCVLELFTDRKVLLGSLTDSCDNILPNGSVVLNDRNILLK